MSDPKDQRRVPLPAVIPEVTHVDGEPLIARTLVVRPSPIPRSLSILLLIMGAVSLGTIFQQESERSHDNNQQAASDNRIIQRLEAQQVKATKERVALRTLVLGIIAADRDRAKVRELLQKYADAEEEAKSATPTPSPAQPQFFYETPTPATRPAALVADGRHICIIDSTGKACW